MTSNEPLTDINMLYNRRIESNHKTATNQSLQLLRFDDQSQHVKTDQTKTTTRGINTPEDDSSLTLKIQLRCDWWIFRQLSGKD